MEKVHHIQQVHLIFYCLNCFIPVVLDKIVSNHLFIFIIINLLNHFVYFLLIKHIFIILKTTAFKLSKNLCIRPIGILKWFFKSLHLILHHLIIIDVNFGSFLFLRFSTLFSCASPCKSCLISSNYIFSTLSSGRLLFAWYWIITWCVSLLDHWSIKGASCIWGSRRNVWETSRNQFSSFIRFIIIV